MMNFQNCLNLSETLWSKCLSGKLRLLAGIILFSSCSRKEQADLILHNAIVYTVDSAFNTAQSFAVKDGKFMAIGSNEEILSGYEAKEIIDAEGKAVYPGFIDAHCHFYGYGKGLQEVDLVGTKSFDEVIQKIVEYSNNHLSPLGEGMGVRWIIGRGWDQNDWMVKEFPDKSKLDSLFPHTPVLITRVDGHGALANSEAFKRA